MSTSKRRFGVALSSELANELDNIVRNFSVDRSKVVEHAVKGFLTEFIHYRRPHKCTGVLILFSREHDAATTTNLIDEYKDIVLAYTHQHVGTHCVEVLIVNGDSEVISDLHKKALNYSCRCRYIPLDYE
ncbi:MAG: ribbon-helix-helix domain-containing protein [Sulfolobales archaeon]|nr:ribbon-helix-helix domain-containing protein [Sulfolobales archaeon]MCX8186253.1 ribbon-helix-helix domain-containing protein [Sulfolobales archaeon]MDW7969011.1 ribbon-helix-helix domain-containing protein [Sulfolobales archaeon]